MLNSVSYAACMKENLEAKGFGHKRVKELLDDYEARAKAYEADGKDAATAAQLAMKDQFDTMSREASEKVKRSAKMLAVQATNIKRVADGQHATTSVVLGDGKRRSKGVAVARAAVSLIEHDPRYVGGNYKSALENTRGQLYALFGTTLEDVGRGAFGRQKGKAHLPNIVREIKGEATGDAVAKSVADAWLKISDLSVDMLNAAGGTMNRLANYLPQGQNGVKVAKGGFDKWAALHMDTLDWNKTRWPDGSVIPAKDRMDVLRNVYNTLSTNGASKIDVGAFRGKGSALGNMIDDHRFLHYKDADAWLKVHGEYGEGNPFEVMVNHIEQMSHKIAMVETFGPNPEMTANNLRSIVRKAAADLGPKELADAEAVLKDKFDPMFETITRTNAMDPNSMVSSTVVGVSNILTSAQLGSAAFLAIPGDFMQTAAVRALNGMGLFRGVGSYVKALALNPKEARELATQSGFVMDEVVMSTYAQSRWTGLATVGPALSRQVSEATMRLSLMSGHTKAARWAVQSEFMGLMQRTRGVEWEKLPHRAVMERYGITKDEWDVFRNGVQPWQPKRGVNFLRPIDVLNTDIPNKEVLYRKFQGMIHDESRTMVPEATTEAAVMMKGTSRPDTLHGAVLHSFAMYKNFPVSFMMIYGRLGMMAQTKMGRLGFYAGLGAGMTMVGALGTQLREIAKGRDPMPMDNAAFLGKAFLSGGALSIWGDFLFAGVNDYNTGPGDAVAGPLAAFLGDTTSLAFGDTFAFADSVGGLQDKEFKSTTATRAVDFAKRYTPGTSIWWARAALERQVWDRLSELADPQVNRKRQRQARKQMREKGNGYWWAPGDRAPERAPSIDKM